MFDNDRYITKGVQNIIPLELQLLMWNCIDTLKKQGKILDYLQVFEFTKLRLDDFEFQSIEHRQEVQIYKKTYNYNRDNKGKIAPLQKEYESLKKQIAAIQAKKDKVLGLYEESMISKQELSARLAKLNEEKEQLENRLNPIWEILNQDGVQQVSFDLVKKVMKRFNEVITSASTREQRKQLLHLLISEITVGESRKVETIRIQLNKDILEYLSINGERLPFNGDDPSFFRCLYSSIKYNFTDNILLCNLWYDI